jgi:hypothetical protein
MAQAFIIGFKAPFDESNTNYRCNRQSLNPGDLMLRTRDENFVVLRRGGVLQIGSTPTCQTIYVPIRNIIRNFCENFELNAFGGDLIWSIERDDQTTTGDAPAKLKLRAKEKASDPGHIAELSIGSHGDSNPVTLELTIRDSGASDAKDMCKLQVTKEGEVTWTAEKNWNLTVAENINVSTTKGDISVTSAGLITATAQKDVSIKSSQGQATLDGMNKATVKSSSQVNVEAPQINLGGASAASQGVMGTELQAWLTQLINQIAALTFIAPLQPAGPAPVVGAPAIASLTASMPTWLSPVVKTK